LSAYTLDDLRGHLAVRRPGREARCFQAHGRAAERVEHPRDRLLAEVVERANARREQADRIAAARQGDTAHAAPDLGDARADGRGDARWVMAQMGHTDARLTLQVYAQVIQRQRIDFDLVWGLMRFPDESERWPGPGARATVPRLTQRMTQ
jgi:integrase